MLIDSYWLKELNKFNTIKVGLSGGLDSCVLLHYLANQPLFHNKLEAIHVNHGLSPKANQWQVYCEEFCKKLAVPLIAESVQINVNSQIEEAARNARYTVFKRFLGEGECLVLAHHQNDQVETLLFNLFRGTGIDGLASIPKHRKLGLGELFRPLLDTNRKVLHKYAKEHNLDWIEDESNLNLDFSRNFIRHAILPVISEKWPSALQNISDCANKCGEARENLTQLALIDCPKLLDKPLQLDLDFIQSLKEERIINVLRSWLKYNVVLSPSSHVFQRIIREVIFAKHDKIPKLVLGKVLLTRYRDCLYLIKDTASICTNIAWENFPNPLRLPDGRVIKAEACTDGIVIGKSSSVWVRFRVGGESIKHNGKSKKLKKLLQELGVLPWERDSLPLLFVDGKLQAVIGLVNADFFNYKIYVYLHRKHICYNH